MKLSLLSTLLLIAVSIATNITSARTMQDHKDAYIVIDKPAYRLSVIEKGDTIFRAPVCLAKNYGNKTRKGDHKTPEGTFQITSIEDASSWSHDFHDGRGKINGAYGPWFFRLNVAVSTHIGIHGTCFPESMGTRDSDGCIRLRNEDIVRLRPLVRKGMNVTITPDKAK